MMKHIFKLIIIIPLLVMSCSKSSEFKSLLKRAKHGDVVAQDSVWICYTLGRGVKKNDIEADKWCRIAAENGQTKAQWGVGNKYYYKAYNGSGDNNNYREAVKWYRLSAEKGYSYAQSKLGKCYYDGNGVIQNYQEAVKWYRLAAEQGNAKALGNLGVCYAKGTGVNQDFIESYKWFLLAYNYSYGIDHEEYLKARDAAMRELTPDEITKAQIEAQAMQEKIDKVILSISKDMR